MRGTFYSYDLFGGEVLAAFVDLALALAFFASAAGAVAVAGAGVGVGAGEAAVSGACAVLVVAAAAAAEYGVTWYARNCSSDTGAGAPTHKSLPNTDLGNAITSRIEPA